MTASRNALVTGASRGIGRAIAVALASSGYRVLCVSTSAGGCDETVAQCGAVGGEASALVCDVSDSEAVKALAKDIDAEGIQIHALVNNAGITRDGLFLRMPEEDFDAVIGVNLRGAFLITKAFGRGMAKARSGCIVNIGSIVGVAGNAGQANYSASKAGLIGFTKSLAKELGGRGVTVNLVAPGFITTDMTAGLPEEIQASAKQNIPLGRFGTPEDIAATVQFLCSDAAAYITGQVLMVDGGMAI
ncbi:MAG: 3-oxoacyl-[acyl-carrier-protein] reductase [Planctomycetota bacterium]|nr:3-oxoacyl-[acyl-carrier-protein] reductase [Planctomycetota bacterium]